MILFRCIQDERESPFSTAELLSRWLSIMSILVVIFISEWIGICRLIHQRFMNKKVESFSM